MRARRRSPIRLPAGSGARVLGLFDSGLGGLTVLRRLRALLPEHDYVFFADQAHVPYGERSQAELARLLQHNVAWLDAQGVDAIVSACNTSCAVAERCGWPPSRAVVLDIIAAAALAVQRAGAKNVGVVATSATARSGAYGRTIRALVPGARVWEVAAPELVPLVEAGESESERARAAVAQACAALPPDLDAVVLACTHYPILDAHFAASLGPGVMRIDPAVVHAERVAELVLRKGLPPGTGTTRYVTNGDVQAFARNVARIMNHADPLVERLEPLAL